jgi:hypothetical protein
LFLIRHLDDWEPIQYDIINICVGLKAHVLASIASWYMKQYPWLRPVLEEHFGVPEKELDTPHKEEPRHTDM